MASSKPRKRRLGSFIEGYKELVRGTPSPARFKEWSALWCISAAVERKVWVETMNDPVYPNLYVMLIARSGAGKGNAIKQLRMLQSSLGSGRLSASSMTSAFLAQSLQRNESSFIHPETNSGVSFHSVNVLSSEAQVLFPEYNLDMLAKLTDTYDCVEYSEGRRKEENSFECERTCMTMLLATTPSHIFTIFPESVWGTGFMSRVILVHGNPSPRKSLFAKAFKGGEREKLIIDLKHDLEIIHGMVGHAKWTPEAARLLDEFYTYPGGGGGPPVPDHPNLLTYLERRHYNLEKLMLLYAIDEGQCEVITEDHYHAAHKLLLDTEATMPEIFKNTIAGSNLSTADQLLYNLSKKYGVTEKPFPESVVIAKLMNRISLQEANNLLRMLVDAGKLEKIARGKLTKELQEQFPDAYWFIPRAAAWADDI